VIDDRIKLPISQHWKDGRHFVVRLTEGKLAVEVTAQNEDQQLAYGT